MAVGDGNLVGGLSYMAVGREITYGTYVTATAGISFLSASMKAVKETKILEEVQGSRTNSNSIQLGKNITGKMQGYFSPTNLACNYLLQNAFGGGPVVSATATGDTTGAVSFTHQVDIANFAATYSSLTMNLRKGDSSTGAIFEYFGGRVNEFTLKAVIDAPLQMEVGTIWKDVTLSSNDVSAKLDTVTSAQIPLSFISGRFSVENSPGSLTSTSFWSVQQIQFKLNNNLVSGSGARRIGSDTLQVLPCGLAQMELSATVRFDTTTAFAAMMAGTRLSAEFEFLGPTLSGSKIPQGIKITMPWVQISDAGDPDIGGPNDPLTSDISFVVLRDPTTSGYAVRAVVTNATSSYA